MREPPTVLSIEVRPTQLRAEISHPGKFFGVLVASRSSATFINEYGFAILERWDVVSSGSGENQLRFAFPVDPGVLDQLDAHLQAVVWVDGVQERVSKPFSVRKWLAENQLLPELKVDVSWADGANGLLRFRAVYTAPTDAYGLGIVSVDITQSTVEVRLKLKTPGPGEGLRDVVETHTAAIDIAAKPGQSLLVFVGETDGIVPIKSFGLTRKLVVPPRNVAAPSSDDAVTATDSVVLRRE